MVAAEEKEEAVVAAAAETGDHHTSLYLHHKKNMRCVRQERVFFDSTSCGFQVGDLATAVGVHVHGSQTLATLLRAAALHTLHTLQRHRKITGT